jgi:hypothetical protein
MDDVCIVLRDIDGTGDAVLDRNTGLLGDDPTVPVYSGHCLVGSATLAESAVEREEGGTFVPRGTQAVSIPLQYMRDHPEAEPLEGDLVVVVSSRRDPALVGKQFNVVRIVDKTMAVSRKMITNPRPADALVELPEILILPVGAPVPGGTPAGTLIIRV